MEKDKQKYIDKPGGRYGLSEGHFFIDCSCGKRKGSSFEVEGDQIATENYNLQKEMYSPRGSRVQKKFEHTFYMNSYVFAVKLINRDEDDEKGSLNVVCNNCGKRFPFTFDSYQKIKDEIKSNPVTARP